MNGDASACVDIDECTLETHTCDIEAETCVNTEGSFNCVALECDEGFELNETGKKCVDINECWIATDECSDLAECANSVGSYECDCNTGYSGDGLNCFDVDECVETPTEVNCATEASCSNTDGSYDCACGAGYSGNGTTCGDVDECTLQQHNCHEFATCTNTEGSFTCACAIGFWGVGSGCFDLDECGHPSFNDCGAGSQCLNNAGSYQCDCPEGFGGTGTTDDPCTDDVGTCDPFAVQGYVGDSCDTAENSVCSASCDSDNDFFTAGDGEELTMSFTCTCDRGIDDGGPVCDWQLTSSTPVDGGFCVECPELPELTWFGDSTNEVKVCGPEGCLIKSRVQANPAVAGDWSSYTIYLMMPGDWTSARVFCWIYDVADIKLEADGTSSLITLTMNANSPTLTSDWTKFFIGFDNIAEHRINTENYKVGVVPGEGTSDTCIMDTNAVSPPESPSRVLPRKQRRQVLRQALKQQRLAQSSTGAGNGHKNHDQTVFIPAAGYEDHETVFIAGRK
jgi:hypothetical protein